MKKSVKKMSTVLVKGNGTSTTFQNTELNSILNNLETSSSQHSVTNSVAFVRLSAGRLLLLDTDTVLSA